MEACTGAMVRDSDDGRTRELHADMVVLAAGAIENARLGAQALSHRGLIADPPVSDVVDHLVQGMFLRLDPPQATRLLDLLGEGSWYAGCRDERSNLFLDVSRRAHGDVIVELQMTGEQMRSDASHISWDPAAGEPWPATVHTELTADELTLIAGQQRRLHEAWEALAAAIGCPATELRFADYDAPQNTNALLLAPSVEFVSGQPETWCNQLGTEDHEGCTLPMGRISSADHELLGVPGVFVAGPAALPRLGAANPALTTIALAHRLAAILAERS
jgi:choline dehydrogenase-like flavoprotein